MKNGCSGEVRESTISVSGAEALVETYPLSMAWKRGKGEGGKEKGRQTIWMMERSPAAVARSRSP